MRGPTRVITGMLRSLGTGRNAGSKVAPSLSKGVIMEWLYHGKLCLLLNSRVN